MGETSSSSLLMNEAVVVAPSDIDMAIDVPSDLTSYNSSEWPTELVTHYAPFIPSVPSLLQGLNLVEEVDHDPRLIKTIFDVGAELGYSGVEALCTNHPEVLAKYFGSSSHQTLAFARQDSSSRANTSHVSLSPKFEKLLACLRVLAEGNQDVRGIIIVKRRTSALAMFHLLRAYLTSHAWRPCIVTGREHEQMQDLHKKFQDGTLNLVIATKAIESSTLKASFVIQFDLFDSRLSYASSLRLCSGETSFYIRLAEEDNDEHRRNITRNSLEDVKSRTSWSRFCDEPWSFLFLANDREAPLDDASDSEDEHPHTIFDPTTGGKVLLHEAPAALGRAVGIEKTPLSLACESVSRGTVRTCSLTIRGSMNLDIEAIASDLSINPFYLAAFRACASLANIGLLPTSVFAAPDSSNQALSELPPLGGQKRRYPRLLPSFWKSCRQSKRLYPMVFRFPNAPELHAPLVFLTYQPLPDLPFFPLFFGTQAMSVITCRGAPFQVDQDQYNMLVGFSTRIVRVITNRPFDADPHNVLHLFAPLREGWSPATTTLPDIDRDIDWELASRCARDWGSAMRFGTAEQIEADTKDTIIVDRASEFTRRYIVNAIRSDMTPLSKPPGDFPHESLLAYAKSHRRNFVDLQDHSQVLVEVEVAPGFCDRLNPVNSNSPSSRTSTKKFLIPELCTKICFPASLYRSALLIPCISYTIDSFMLVKELNAKHFRCTMDDKLLRMACTSTTAALNFDYERLELLGDSFLKYISSVYLFIQNASTEGDLHNHRINVISNKALLVAANRTGLYGYIQSIPFSLRQWQLPGFALSTTSQADKSGKIGGKVSPTIDGPSEDTLNNKSTKRRRRMEIAGDSGPTQWLADKVVADILEAVVGAAYLSGGRDTALRTIKALSVLPFADSRGPTSPDFACWEDFNRRYKYVEPPVSIPNTAIAAVENMIGSNFAFRKKACFLQQALTDPASGIQNGESYERLEFLGDAILEFMVVEYLFRRDCESSLSPGALTLLKGAMVNGSILAAICVEMGLHEHLVIHRKVDMIQDYISQLASKRRQANFWTEVEPPKILSDVLEAVIGAVYVASGFQSSQVFFDNVLQPFYEEHLMPPNKRISLSNIPVHPTKILLELIQQYGCNNFKIESEKSEDGKGMLCSVLVHDIVLANAQEFKGTAAAKSASSYALDALEGDPTFIARTCDCKQKTKNRKGSSPM